MKKNILLLVILIVLGVASWLAYKKAVPSTIANEPLTAFAIQDTAAVNKIVITDQLGKTATLERIPGEKLWKLNNKYYAREDAVEIMLRTFYRIKIRGNVSDPARDNMMKLLATSGKKVAIYMGGDEPAKIYYVGVATPDHTGTVMLLEIPGIGRAEDPYITHMEGFTGFLSTRFFTDESEWRYTGIFEYPNLDFTQVQIINHIQPGQSFMVKYTGDNNVQLFDQYDVSTKAFGHQEAGFDTSAVKTLLLQFKKIHVESFNTLLKTEQADSIRISKPAFTISVVDSKGTEKSIDLFFKRATEIRYDESGQIIPWDQGYFWAKTMDNDLALAQAYNFGPLVNPLDAYLSKK